MQKKPLFIAPNEKLASLKVVGETIQVLASGAQTGSYEVFLQLGPEGAGPPPHHHPWDEAYFVLEGEIDVRLGDRQVVAPAGSFVHVPAGVVHNFRMRSKSARFLSITSREGAAKFFVEMDREASEVPPNMEKIVAVATRNHVIPAGPPPAE